MRAGTPERSGGIAAVLFVIGWLLVLLGLAMGLPMLADMISHRDDWRAFGVSGAFTIFAGVLLVLTNRRPKLDLQFRSIFLITALSWVVVVSFSALPMHVGPLRLSITDAVFEAMSGMTTTGSTVIVGLDTAPPGVLLWRSLLRALEPNSKT